MPRFLSKRGFWITALFVVINIAGLWAIVAAIEGRGRGLHIEAFQPEGVASTQAIVTVRFDQPMVLWADAGSEVADGLLEVFPPVAGRAVWQDARTLTFEPAEQLRLATAYTVTVSRRFTSLLGNALGRDRVFGFQTPRLDLVNARQTGRSRDGQVMLALAFNDKVRPEDVGRYLKLSTGDGETLRYDIGGRVPSEEVRLSTEPYGGQWVTAHLAKGLQGVSGPLGLADDRTMRLKVEAGLRISHLAASAQAPEDVHIQVSCTQRVDARAAGKFVRVEPEVEFTTSSCYGGFKLCGPFLPGKRYRLTFLKGLPGAEGSFLEKETVRSVTVPDCDPLLRFKTRGIYLSARGSLLLPLESVNVAKADLSLERVYANNVVHYLRNLAETRNRWYGTRYRKGLGHTVLEQSLPMDGPRNALRVEHIDLRKLLGDDPHGLFLASARDAKHSWTQDEKVIVVTDLGLSVKQSETGLLVWVCALSTATPVAGAKIAVFTLASQQVLTGTTGEQGVAHFTNVDTAGDRAPYAVTATKGDDTGLVVIEETALDTSDLDTGGRAYLREGYEAFLYADRGIYRPGSEAVLRTIVRGPDLAVPKPFPVQFRLTRPDGRHYKTLTATLSQWGSAEVTVDLPRYALTGRYGIELRLPGSEAAIGRHRIQVEQFLPNRMKVELVPTEDRRFKAGEKLSFLVKASHLFGAPAAGRRVEVSCRLVPAEFSHPEWAGYRFADGGKTFAAGEEIRNTDTLDAKGEKAFAFQVPKALPCPSTADVVLSATVKEVGGRGVSATLARHIDAHPRYVGLARESKEYGAIGREERIQVALVEPDGSPVDGVTLDGRVHRIVWHTVMKADEHGRLRYISESEEQEIAKLSCAVRAGRGVVTFKPTDYGEYVVRMRDPEGGASADIRFYCSGAGYVPWAKEQPSRIELVADKEAYAPGDEAVVLVKAPFAGQALLTVESDRVHVARSMVMEANTAEFRFPVDGAFGPNVYCTATVIRKVAPEGEWAAHRAYGAVPIVLDSQPRRLAVTVQAAEEVRPGQPLRVALQVRDATGAGRRAEVTLAAVDEGICQLTRYRTPDPWEFFFAKRSLAVGTSDIYSLLMPEVAKKQVGGASAAGGDGNEPDYDPRLFNPVSADRVRQVALWRSGIETDDEGRAEVVLDVPEFTGQLRLMAVAAGARDFGASERPTLVKKPLLVRASFPRFVAPGDRFTVPVTVFNNTGAGGTVAVATEATGGLEFMTGAPERIEVEDGRDATLLLGVRAPGTPGPATLSITARLGGETTVERVELAVRPPTTLTFTSGSGSIEPGTTARIPFPDGWLEGTDSYSLSFSTLPTLKLGASLRYLVRYPYGCIEQTTSCGFPLLYAGDIIDAVDPERFDKDAAADFLQAAIDRVLSMQGYNGGFGGWPGYWHPYPWGSVYATHFLVEAKKAGCDVPGDNLDAALDYLDGMLADDGIHQAAKAYACYVLALAGRPNASWTYRLWEEREELAAYSRVHVALALALKQERQLVADFLRQAKLPEVTDRRDTGGVLYSSTRESAMLLSGFLDLNPRHPYVPLLVERLEKAMTGYHWRTTQENAFAVMALGKYARHAATQDVSLTATATLDGKELAAFTHKDKIVLRPEGVAGKAIEVATAGKGTLYFYWGAEGIPLKAEAVATDDGLMVRRRFLSRDGAELDAMRIPHGEVVLVEIAVRAGRPVENLVINDLLPAGFEIENPNIATSETIRLPSLPPVAPPGMAEGGALGGEVVPRLAEPLNPDRVERRDDRLIVFADLGSTRPYYHRYLVRAVTRGRFKLPAVTAFAMYDPGIRSTHGAGTVEIVDAP